MERRLIPGNGDGFDFSQTFKNLHAPLVIFACRFTNDQDAAEDIVEDAFVSLWIKRDSLTEIQSLKAYLYTVVRNGCLSWMRKNRRAGERDKNAISFSAKFEQSTLENMIYSETMAGLYAAIDRLPRQCRKVFVMHYIQGKKIAEIAAELNISVGTVKTHKSRGIDLLKKGLLTFFYWVSIAATMH